MKKITIFVMALLVAVTCCFAGCSTFKVNYVKYYNEVVAEVDGYEITRHELINSYNSYGYNYYVSQQGKSEQEALESTLNLLIDRKLLVGYIKGDDKYTLDARDVNELYAEVLETLQSNYDSYFEQAKKIYDITDSETESDEDEEETFKIADYKYKKRAYLVDTEIHYNEDVLDDLTEDDFVLDRDFAENFNSKRTSEIVTKMYAKFIEETNENVSYETDVFEKLHNKAFSLMSKNLIAYEYYLRDKDGNAYSTDTISLVKRYIERVYNSALESAYISKFEDYYVKNEVKSVSVLKEKYIELVETDYAKYQNSTADYYNYLKTIGSDAEMIYYTPTEATNGKFGYFLHVLLPIDEDVIEEVNGYEDDGIYDEVNLQLKKDERLKEQTHQERDVDTGKLIDGEKKIGDILQEYANDVRTLDDFIDFMFRYTSDTATLTADKPYVIGYDGETNYSNMVDEFTEEAIRLLKNGLTKTEYNEYIVTKYGIHLLYYVGEVKADFAYDDRFSINISSEEALPNNLYYTNANDLIEKTYFDVLFDLVYPASTGSVYASTNGYTTYEESLLEGMRDNVVTYKTKLKNTLDVL